MERRKAGLPVYRGHQGYQGHQRVASPGAAPLGVHIGGLQGACSAPQGALGWAPGGGRWMSPSVKGHSQHRGVGRNVALCG